jgi:regulator of replication initiation timing
LAFLGRFTNHSLQDERARCINKLGEVKKKIVDIIERCDALNLIPLEKRKQLKQVASGNENCKEEEEEEEGEENPIVQSGLMPNLQGENALRQSSNINELLERAHRRRRRAYQPPPKRQNVSALAVERAAKTVVAQEVRDHNEEMLAIAGTRAEMGICEENAEQILEQERLATRLQEEEVREYKETKKRKKGSVKDRITQKLRMLKRSNRAGGR